MGFEMRITPARRRFKRLLGQTNHFIITILIGLEAVETGKASIGDTFRTSWSPHDVGRSSARSREFALNASLAWTVDALDCYLRLARRQPMVMIESLTSTYDADGASLSKRIQIVASGTGHGADPAHHLARLAVTWRNRLVHSLAELELATDSAEALRHAADRIRDDYQGLEVEPLLAAVSERRATRPPTFKEATSLVRAAHTFVAQSDDSFIASLDVEKYFLDALRSYLSNDTSRRLHNIWGKDANRARRSLGQIAQEFGLAQSEQTGPSAMPTDRLAEVSKWTIKDARRELIS
jgi:hypothetical protein